MERDNIKQSERVRVVPIFASDVAPALRDLDANLPEHRFRYGSASLAEIFDKLQIGGCHQRLETSHVPVYC